MLNQEQLLIKASQYLNFDLKRLGIKQTAEQERFYKHQTGDTTIKHKTKKIYTKLMTLQLNKNLEYIFSEFLSHYDYIYQELNSSINSDEEKIADWFLLKHFVIPFFAVRISQAFAHYHNRIDIGLPGSDFWYLPSIDAETNKIKFPLNKIIDWLIDLYGSSNASFYLNATHDLDEATLKKWHHQFVLPDYKSMNTLSISSCNYKGTIQLDKTLSLNKQYESVLNFLKSKKVTAEQLKLEIPNINNLVERAYENNLNDEEKEKFIMYITQRWSQPSNDILKKILLTARVTQSCYKELLQYFNISTHDGKSYEKNFILQLSNFFCYIYNQSLNRDTASNAQLFDSYIYNIKLLSSHTKDALDCIISEILFDLHEQKPEYKIDEVMFVRGVNKVILEQSIDNIVKRGTQRESYIQQGQITQNAIAYINSYKENEMEKKLDCVYSIKNPVTLNNLGDYYSGNNYLTNEEPRLNIDLALHIYLYNYNESNNYEQKKRAYFQILNLFTFPYYPKRLSEKDVQAWIDQKNKFINSTKDELGFLGYLIYHEINKQNTKEVIILIKQYIEVIKNLKPQEYNSLVLCIAQKYMEFIKNEKLRKKLEKINQKNTHYEILIQNSLFYFYQ